MSSLSAIAREIKRCTECKRGKSGRAVPGEGNPRARVMFVGEAPGREEAKTGRPFVGRSGKFLTGLLASIGVDRKEVFITSPVKYYPASAGRNPLRRAKARGRAPTDREIRHGKIHLEKQIAAIQPRIIVLMGRVAHKALLGDVKISRVHGKTMRRDGLLYFSTFHPAAALRFPRVKRLIKKDFKKLKRALKFKSGAARFN